MRGRVRLAKKGETASDEAFHEEFKMVPVKKNYWIHDSINRQIKCIPAFDKTFSKTSGCGTKPVRIVRPRVLRTELRSDACIEMEVRLSLVHEVVAGLKHPIWPNSVSHIHHSGPPV